MTTAKIRRLATEALDAIDGMPKGHVHASRRGIVAGVLGGHGKPTAHDILFRRYVTGVRLEVWPHTWTGGTPVPVYPLPPDLDARAAAMLDAL